MRRRRGVGAIARYKAAVREIKRRRAKGLPEPVTPPEPPTPAPWWADKEDPPSLVGGDEDGGTSEARHDWGLGGVAATGNRETTSDAASSARPAFIHKEGDTVSTEPGDFTTTYQGQPFRVDAWDPARGHLVRVWTRAPEREARERVAHHGWTDAKYAQVRNRKTGD